MASACPTRLSTRQRLPLASSSCASSRQAGRRSSSTRVEASARHPLHHIGRRASLFAALGLPLAGDAAQAGLFSTSAPPQLASPVIDVPMERLKLPPGGVGADYPLLKVSVQGRGPFDFMIDSGLTSELITPHLCEQIFEGETALGKSRQKVAGLGAGGAVNAGEVVELQGAALVGGSTRAASRDQLPLPNLTAVVTPFPQEHLDPAHDPVEGMLGMELLSQFDADLDFTAGRFRVWAPGEGTAAAAQAGLVAVPAAVLNETGLLGIRVTSTTAAKTGAPQPVVGIIDCGASFSAVNWAAAGLMGLPPRGDSRAYGSGPTIYSVGVDGRPMPLPTTSVQLTYTGNPVRSSRGPLTFEPAAKEWKPWKPISVAVGDLPVFEQLLGDGRTPFSGPAALIGLDVLSQRRVMLAAGSPQDRRRALYVSPK